MCLRRPDTTALRRGPVSRLRAELDCIALLLHRRRAMRGGIGTVIGALVGAMIMASLDNGMSMLGIDTSGSRSQGHHFWCWLSAGLVTSGAQR